MKDLPVPDGRPRHDVVRPMLGAAVIALLLVLWGLMGGGVSAATPSGAETPAPASEAAPASEFKLSNIIGERIWQADFLTLNGAQDVIIVNLGALHEQHQEVLQFNLDEHAGTMTVRKAHWSFGQNGGSQAWLELEGAVPVKDGQVQITLLLERQPVMGDIHEPLKKSGFMPSKFELTASVEGRAIHTKGYAGGMDATKIFTMIFGIVGGLGIFMLGMKHMSDGLQTVAGSRLRTLISAVTDNRVLAVLIGTGVTCVVQSSSVTTVMVVGFVNSGLMTLSQAIGVTMGANIGTTITGWILALKIGKYGLPILGVAALFYRFSKRDRVRYLALIAMGIGMIFFGLLLMKNGFKPIRYLPAFKEWLGYFRADDYFGVLACAAVGCVLTMIVQSSSATLGITIALAVQGPEVMPFTSAAALVLGENIGTTITAWLASIGTTTNAKRAAYAHVIFNVLGVLWITAIFQVYVRFVVGVMGGDATVLGDPMGVPFASESLIIAGIAAVHTGFNVTNVVAFLPFTGRLARFLERVVPEKKHKEAPHLTSLHAHLLESPVVGIEQSRVELLRMGQSLRIMMEKLRSLMIDGFSDETIIKKVFHREEVLDIMQKEVVTFLSEMFSGTVAHDVVDEGRQQLRIADEYESVGDYIADILKMHLRLRDANVELSEEARSELLGLHDALASYVEMIDEAVKQRHGDILSKACSQGDAITHSVRDLRARHLERVTARAVAPLVTVMYGDTINAYRRIRDHMFNVAEALAGEK